MRLHAVSKSGERDEEDQFSLLSPLLSSLLPAASAAGKKWLDPWNQFWINEASLQVYE